MSASKLNTLILHEFGSKRAFMRAMSKAKYDISYRSIVSYCITGQQTQMTIARAKQISEVLKMPLFEFVNTITGEGDE